MHIGVDGRELGPGSTGVGRYLQRLLQEWGLSPEARTHRFTVYSPDGRIALPPDLNGEVSIATGGGGTAWEQGALAHGVRRDRPDVFFAPGYSAPLLTGVPFVVVMHDVSFAAHPEWFGLREGMRRRALARLAGRRAGAVLTLADFSRDEIVRHLGVPRDRIQVIPLGIGLEPSGAPTAVREPLVLYVGSIFDRRHVPELIEGFAGLTGKQPAARLTLVGANRTLSHADLPRLARQAGVADRVTHHDWLPDADLAALYARASVFGFLSEYEGFGLTPLEALAAGVPPLVLDTPVSREVYGEAAWRIDRPDPDLVTDALSALLDPVNARRRAILEAAPGVVARYSWRVTAERTLAALAQVARR